MLGIPLYAYEWAGALFGLVGALLVATNTAFSRIGWYSFLLANIAMIVFAVGQGANGLLFQQIGFLATSALGLYRTRKAPAI